FLELELGRRSPSRHGETVVVNVLMAELQTGFLEETLPADPVYPLADSLVTAGARCVSLDDVLDRLDRGGPPGRFVGDKGNSQLRKHRGRFHVGNLAAHPNGDPVTLSVRQG